MKITLGCYPSLIIKPKSNEGSSLDLLESTVNLKAWGRSLSWALASFSLEYALTNDVKRINLPWDFYNLASSSSLISITM